MKLWKETMEKKREAGQRCRSVSGYIATFLLFTSSLQGINKCYALPSMATATSRTSTPRRRFPLSFHYREAIQIQRHDNDANKTYYNPLRLRGGAISVAASSSSNAATSNDAKVSIGTSKSKEISTRRRYLRIARELCQHVWPPVPKKAPNQKVENVGGEITPYYAIEKERKVALAIRCRVIASIFLMLAGKFVTIATPFIFKSLVDLVPTYIDVASSTSAAAAAATSASSPLANKLSASSILANSPIPLPILLLLSYGICRSASSLFRESTNAIFAHVAQSAIRRFGRSTFDHVHSLDLQYHLNRNTGALSRVLERGSRSISYTLNAMVFNTIPTLIEVGVVMGLMYKKFGLFHALTVMVTIVTYSAYTIFVTQWRSKIRKDMIALDNRAAGKVSDSLLNYETVKYFNNEMHEGVSYEQTLHQYQKMALKASRSLSALNFGQNAIFSVGLVCIMYLTLQNVKHG
mmetsp:Transcript_38354/g.82630  ORF Transcript_38354/g.82630 Transcript_38354/m.82630 type:complete len:465 (+) Transcript_38354:45-1439(+)